MEERVWHRFYDQGVPASIDFEGVSVPGFLEQSALEYGDSTAVIFMNCRLTYRQLKEEVDRFATALARLGVGKDTRVAIQLPNLPQTVVAYYATLSLGAHVVMTNPLYVEREITHQWDGCWMLPRGGCGFPVRESHQGHSREVARHRLRHRIDPGVPALPTQPARAYQAQKSESPHCWRTWPAGRECISCGNSFTRPRPTHQRQISRWRTPPCSSTRAARQASRRERCSPIATCRTTFSRSALGSLS